MTGSLEDTIAPVLARWLKPLTADDAATAVADALWAAGVVPAEPAGHDTLFEGSPATFAKIVGDDILGPDLPERIAVYAVAVVDGEAPAT